MIFFLLFFRSYSHLIRIVAEIFSCNGKWQSHHVFGWVGCRTNSCCCLFARTVALYYYYCPFFVDSSFYLFSAHFGFRFRRKLSHKNLYMCMCVYMCGWMKWRRERAGHVKKCTRKQNRWRHLGADRVKCEIDFMYLVSRTFSSLTMD